uniref:PDZ domain-containing protein n=1 Tax=Cyclopterus lumpus TaxID=8103 RepID=A0A8C3AZR2_CYCLU
MFHKTNRIIFIRAVWVFFLLTNITLFCVNNTFDYIIKEKSVLLQKKDSEGFGFVLRGAKAQTPIEEFTPTPAFPALQYLESVDEGGVAWRAGLRMGDFLIEVNGQNVVKVGHRQVVNMIRQGGNSLMVKVVMVTRNPDMEEGSRKKSKSLSPSKRLSTPAIALRSKSMTSELEEMGKKSAWINFWGFNPSAHRAVYQPLCSTHTHTHTYTHTHTHTHTHAHTHAHAHSHTQQVFVATVTLQRNGHHLRRVFRVPQTSLLSVWLSCVCEQVAKYVLDIFC